MKRPVARMLVPVALLFSCAPLAGSEEVTKWEYRVIRIEDRRPDQAGGRAGRGSAEEALNKLGAEGWELVSVRIDSQANRSNPIFYFKRPLRGAPAEKGAAEKAGS